MLSYEHRSTANHIKEEESIRDSDSDSGSQTVSKLKRNVNKISDAGKNKKEISLTELQRNIMEIDRKCTSIQKMCEPNKIDLIENKQENNELYEDLKRTVEDFKNFVVGMEVYSAERIDIITSYGEETWSVKDRIKEKLFQQSLINGIKIINKFVNAITMEPHPADLYNFFTNYDDTLSAKEYHENSVNFLERTGYSLLLRFARLLEREGIKHNLPVPKEKLNNLEIRTRTASERIQSVCVRCVSQETKLPNLQDLGKVDKPVRKFKQSDKIIKNEKSICIGQGDEFTSDNSSKSEINTGESSLTSQTTPSSFLKTYANYNNYILNFTETSHTTSQFSPEVIVACRINTLGVEGKGRNKLVAREVASAELLRVMLKKIQRGTLPQDMVTFTVDEKMKALELTCKYINYEEALNALIRNEHNPTNLQYSQIFNVPNGFYSYRCKALGFNGVGIGPTKEIAKRMGAKLVMDQIAEKRESYLINKYGKRKAKKLLKKH